VSNASEDFPDPDSPVITTSLLRGMATLQFFRLFTLARLMMIKSFGLSSSIEELGEMSWVLFTAGG
jgi:hypothetical protein